MLGCRRTLACSLLLLPLLAATADADAKAPKVPKIAVFKASVRGTQVTTWSYRIAEDPNERCDSSQTGDGSQTVRFTTARSARVQVMRGDVFGFVPAKVSVEREGEYAPGYEAASDCPAVADGDDLVPLVPPDCGTRTGTAQLRFEYGGDEAAGDLAPLRRTNQLVLLGDVSGVADYADCPWWIGGPADGPSDTELLPSGEPIKFKRLLDRRRKVIRLSGDYTRTYADTGFTGKTLVTWNLTLRRVR
jgi:hypothetical protein